MLEIRKGLKYRWNVAALGVQEPQIQPTRKLGIRDVLIVANQAPIKTSSIKLFRT